MSTRAVTEADRPNLTSFRIPGWRRLGLGNAVLYPIPSLYSSPPYFPPTFVTDTSHVRCTYVKRDQFSETKDFGRLISILVVPSGTFAWPTLEYTSLDETQSNVLGIRGTQ